MSAIDSFLQQLGIAAAPGAVAICCIIIGLLSLLYGYRLFRLFVFLGGFVVAAALTALVTDGLVPLIADLKVLAALQIILSAVGVECQYTVTSGRTAVKKEEPEK